MQLRNYAATKDELQCGKHDDTWCYKTGLYWSLKETYRSGRRNDSRRHRWRGKTLLLPHTLRVSFWGLEHISKWTKHMHMHSWRIYAKVVTYREEVVDGLRLGIIACPLLLEYPLGPLLRQPVPLRKLLRQHLLCRLSLPLNGVLRTLNNIQIIVIIAT